MLEQHLGQKGYGKNEPLDLIKHSTGQQHNLIPWRREWLPTPLAWRIPWTEKPGGLQFMGLQKVRHDYAPNTFLRSSWKKKEVAGYTGVLFDICCINNFKALSSIQKLRESIFLIPFKNLEDLAKLCPPSHMASIYWCYMEAALTVTRTHIQALPILSGSCSQWNS